jgi:hypothetical protein
MITRYKHILIILLFSTICYPGILFAQTPDWLWAQQGGGVGGDLAYGLYVDADGNSYITGYFQGEATFGTTSLVSNGDIDLFVAKLDSSGNYIWIKGVGGVGADSGTEITVDDSGNVYVTGKISGVAVFDEITLTSNGNEDMFVAKYDTSGTAVWAINAGSYMALGTGIGLDADGYIYVSGWFKESISIDGNNINSFGSVDIILAKFDPLGNAVWVKAAGGIYADFAFGLAVDGVGNSYITGSFNGQCTFEDTTLVSDGIYPDMYIAKYDVLGNAVWARRAGGPRLEDGRAVRLDESQNVYVTGQFQDFIPMTTDSLIAEEVDIFVLKYDAAGELVWGEGMGGPNNDAGLDLAIDTDGNLYITGAFAETAQFGNVSISSFGDVDVFVVKYDEMGNFLWVESVGGTLDDTGHGIVVDSIGSIYVAGFCSGTVAFGNNSLIFDDDYDAFIAKFGTPLLQSIERSLMNNILLSPNPVVDILTIRNSTNKYMTLQDNIGRLMWSGKVSDDRFELNLSNWATGTYILRLHDDRSIEYVKFLLAQ